ncbi:AbrB/MazE/SpoVT family DNA-binding domain-containing protein [Methylosinus sp. Sm6]|uniref:AbrB/MazE/SpoVT family DNA-binding domain-containing protein n=1 Tax=Methylosinus sp. Sm6 TaxID=2866948 RepID=UPI001C9A2A4F|nr:AbrB/MazE/SpoVT family DNA-binding domain-containing protein [Methylosinus sp. Sm6]MBY6240742.1 type II toxin-antitoxin system PrlF family antitoxin [Methylosinus sp. Sm6]
MTSAPRKTVYSKVSVKSQTVVPAEVRERLRIKPGDRLRYIIDDTGVRIERSAPGQEDDPFATFSEWASDADDEAYADL